MSSSVLPVVPRLGEIFRPNAGKGSHGRSTGLSRWGLPNRKPLRIQALSDSILARGAYFPFGLKLDSIPLWTAGKSFNAGNVCRNSAGHLYYTTVAGVTTTEPVHITGNVVDGTLNWFYYPTYYGKDSTSELFWAEKYSNGGIVWNVNEAYTFPYLSLGKVIVISGGQGYRPEDTLSFTVKGAEAKLNIDPSTGAIQSVTITNCGYNNSGFLDYTINTKTGSGAVLSLVHTNSGTFGVSGCRTRDGRARLADILNHPNPPDVLVVSLGSNDGTLDVTNFSNAATVATSVIEDLRYIYDRASAAGILVLAKPMPPKTAMTPPLLAFRTKIRSFIRAYARGEPWANPHGYQILLSEPTPYLQDSSTPSDPIGGTGLSIGSVTVDGTHNSPLGAQVGGFCIFECLQSCIDYKFLRPRESGTAFGYDLTNNPGGNMFEALPWFANADRNVGDWCSNDSNKIYRCVTPGKSAAAGGPTGTGSNIVDGTAQWTYIRQGGMSVLNSGTGGTKTATGSIVYSGNLITGATISRLAGSALGNVDLTQPTYSGAGGFKGQSQKIQWTLNSGTVGEQWRILISNLTLANMAIPNSDLGVVPYQLAVEMQLSGISNANTPYIQLFGQSGILTSSDGFGLYSFNNGQAGYEMMPSSGGFFPYPNNGRYTWVTPKTLLPVGITSLNAGIFFNFNVAAAATLTCEIFNISLIRADQ